MLADWKQSCDDFSILGGVSLKGCNEGPVDRSLSTTKTAASLANGDLSAPQPGMVATLNCSHRTSLYYDQRSRPPAAFANPRTPMPPSQMITLPVAVEELFAEASSTYDPVYSRGSDSVPSGNPRSTISFIGSSAIERSAIASEAGPRRSVGIAPGATPLTRIFGASSYASCRIRP